MNDEVEQSVAAYRQVARGIAREQGQSTATIIFAGISAEYLRRQEVGATVMDTHAETLLEVVCGDVLATSAVQEIGGLATIRVTNWVASNWNLVQDHADRLLALQGMLGGSVDTPQPERCYVVAAMECVATASDSTTADLAYGGAVAVARTRLGDRWYCLSAEDRDDVLAEVICGDPAWAAAAEELSEGRRGSVRGRVCRQWDEIARQVTEMEVIDTAERLVTVDSVAAGARYAMEEWLRRLPGLDPKAVAYGAAAAEGLARWRHRGGAKGDEELIMRGWAATDPTVTGALETMPAPVRETMVHIVRAMLPELASLN
ncbi:hypothetical protein [Mycobacteroides abscessus]|uniref:DUF222 domain-containing protein n=1 Tax=Mycobacteroides abscessus TaxID=36809 RepID=A0AB33SZI7_9MYCO|nr:hypothetical protein [Mycobacteroides abscessus]CPT03767.1 Uncharacterised protein [Mycobacteroides abscessus]CPT67819.1 Uncharacterised protein [Mycobacteroides abscessus]CPT69051.1 Uncharacterised protein [Mycobacteroides abscessus]CPV12573.1 Uncharacterised protein [Mycobacteroides abscessus]CPV59412.1 Uncharacterised protein [Mycobacteroides abscessus]